MLLVLKLRPLLLDPEGPFGLVWGFFSKALRTVKALANQDSKGNLDLFDSRKPLD